MTINNYFVKFSYFINRECNILFACFLTIINRISIINNQDINLNNFLQIIVIFLIKKKLYLYNLFNLIQVSCHQNVKSSRRSMSKLI